MGKEGEEEEIIQCIIEDCTYNEDREKGYAKNSKNSDNQEQERESYGVLCQNNLGCWILTSLMENYDLMISSAQSKVLGKISTSQHYMLLGALGREPQFNIVY